LNAPTTWSPGRLLTRPGLSVPEPTFLGNGEKLTVPHSDQQSGLHTETELTRDLGLTTALAIGVGTMIAAGIFTLSGLAVRNVGSAAIVSFLLAAAVALFTALTYCEFVSIYPESGEGYLYARHTFRPPVAYCVGWLLFLGYTSSCAFYIASLSSYFREFIWNTPFPAASGVAALFALTLLNMKGTKESGSFQVVVTLSKILLLLWFVLGGLGSVRGADLVDQFSNDMGRIAATSAMVFITFFGFSAIAASAGEVKDPVKTIPRAIFLSMGIVTVLYSLVVIVVIAAGLNQYTEAAMGMAAKKFLGSVGGFVIVGGALFSMISASNASIMAGSRVMLAMSRRGHFPAGFGAVNPQTRTPIVSLILVGGTILVFTISLGLEDLAHFADSVLLTALILVNAALIVHRRKHPNLERPFRVPLVPLLPALGIAANLYLLIQIAHHPAPMAMAVTCVLLGLAGFTTWKGMQPEEVALPGRPSRVALERSSAVSEGRFRVLVALANPDSVPQLIKLASQIAIDRGGEIVALRVAVVPEQLPPRLEGSYLKREQRILEQAHAAALNDQVPVVSLLRVGHSAARAILETARERDCDLILLGWKGYTSTTKKILGEVVDAVVNHARTDVMLVKLVGDQPLRRFLLPSAGGKHARCAEGYIASILRTVDGSVTLCSVVRPEAADKEVEEVDKRLADASGRLIKEVDPESRVQRRLIRHKSVTVGVIEESTGYDAVVVGAAGGSIYPQILFGSIPETIAKRCPQTVVLVKRHRPVKALMGRVIGE
jgi:APA family basic amino acid/polyamine antiporter